MVGWVHRLQTGGFFPLASQSAPTHTYPKHNCTTRTREMLPAGNLYERWTATPGIPGEPQENVTLTLKFEAMGAQVCGVGAVCWSLA